MLIRRAYDVCFALQIITSGGVTYKSEPWHRECFTCTNCSTSLAGQRFTSRDEKPYCADCFGELFAKRCTACTKPITGEFRVLRTAMPIITIDMQARTHAPPTLALQSDRTIAVV